MTFRDMVQLLHLRSPVPGPLLPAVLLGRWPPIPEVSLFLPTSLASPPLLCPCPSSPAGICGLEMGCQMPTIVILKCPVRQSPPWSIPSAQAGRLPAENTRDNTCLVLSRPQGTFMSPILRSSFQLVTDGNGRKTPLPLPLCIRRDWTFPPEVF